MVFLEQVRASHLSGFVRLISTGKTILASVIIENCLGATGTTCIYFYCKQGDPHRNNFLSLARTLLAQLLQQHQDLLPHFYDQLLSSGQSSVTSLKLCQELLQMTLQHGQKTHIITDGLDECDESERRTILSWFNSAVDDCSKNDPGRLRILFVSQDVPDIRKMLHAASSFRLTADNTGKDIEPYVRHWTAKIKQKFEIADGDVYALTDSICKKAEGMLKHINHFTFRLIYRQECFFMRSWWLQIYMHNHL